MNIHVFMMKYHMQISFKKYFYIILIILCLESQRQLKISNMTQISLSLCTDILKLPGIDDDTMKKTLTNISEEISSNKPLDNFYQWINNTSDSLEDVQLTNVEINASSVNGQKTSVKNIVKNDNNIWEALQKEDPSYINIFI